MDEFKSSTTALVGDVDCTDAGKSLCEKHKVTGYPTIKWGEPSDLKDYDGGRDLDSLRKFATENLGPTCGPNNVDLCDPDDKKFIVKFMKWDIDELDMAIEEKDEKIKGMETKMTKVIDSLKKQESNLNKKVESEKKKKDDAIAKEKKNSGYAYIQAIRASRAKGAEEKAEEDAFEAEMAESDDKKGEL